ncbi:MAG: response regulator [Magnetococcales bacterium]|nr:response regulator [Magnetococcales bacterium]
MMFKVVIVDDEVHIRALLEQTMEELEEEFEFEILTAANGGDGLAAIQREHPRLVFLDVMMPVMNGYDVCAAVRADSSLDETKVVMLTAKGQETDRQRGMSVGVNHFITKPFDPDEIVNLAREILGS